MVCSSICSSAQALKLPWSSSLQLLLVAPISRDASLAPVLHLPSKEPPLFQDQDPMKVGKCFTRLKARPSQNSRGEVSGSHPGMRLHRAARRALGIYFSKHKHTEIQEGRLGGSSVGCREQRTLACWLSLLGPLLHHQCPPPPNALVGEFGGFTWTTLRITFCS